MSEYSAPPRRKPVQHEWKAQETDAAFLRLALPYDAYWTAIDGGRAANVKVGAARKKRGIKAGIPDFLIVWNGITLWIERKVDARLSEAQKTTRDYLERNGHNWFEARSTEDVEQACLSVGIPLRATLGEAQARIEAAHSRKKTSRSTTKRAPRYTLGKGTARRARKAGILI